MQSFIASNGAPVDTPPEIPSGKPASPVDQSAFQSQEPSSNAPVTALSGGVIENKNIVRRKLTGYVGFANLPNQWHRKSVRKGFNFNVMVVGKCRQLQSLSATPIAKNCLRRVWSRKVYPGEHALQHFAVPAKGAQGA